MKAPTHIIGGYMFTGTLCSFTDVNIFERPEYLIACAAFSILPDIDTTKSAVGKVFYPISWVLYRKFGHRTITHSALFFFFVWATIYFLTYFSIIQNPNYLKIALFSIMGHYAFDMITFAGIPLLYPFYKNPCVVPANPSYRFNSNDIKSEIIVIGICGLLCFTMQPLFSNGFWTSYNRMFATIKHVDRENKNTEHYVICEYSYILNAETKEGEAIVIASSTNELVMFDGENVITIDSNNPQIKVNYTKPYISDIEKRFEERQFFNISYDSLQSMLREKFVTSGLIQSNRNVQYIDNAITHFTNYIKFSNRYDFRITATVDTMNTNTKRNIARLEASILQSRRKFENEMNTWLDHEQQIISLIENLKSDTLSLYERNKKQQELIKLRNKSNDHPVYSEPIAQVKEIELLKKSLTDNVLLFSGHITVLCFNSDPSSSDPHRPPMPRYDLKQLFDNKTYNVASAFP